MVDESRMQRQLILQEFRAEGHLTVWQYLCPQCQCELLVDERMEGRAIPFCSNNRSHGRLALAGEVDTKT